MLLQEGLTHVHSPKKPRLHSGESFTLKGKAGNILRFSPLSTNAINRPKPISWLVFQHSPTSIPETVAFNNKSAGFHWRRTVKTSNLQTRLLFPGATTFTYDHVLCWYGKLVCKELLLYTSSIYRATLIYFATCFWPSAEWMSNITFFFKPTYLALQLQLRTSLVPIYRASVKSFRKTFAWSPDDAEGQYLAKDTEVSAAMAPD